MLLSAYLERIGVTGPLHPDVETLYTLHRAHFSLTSATGCRQTQTLALCAVPPATALRWKALYRCVAQY